MSATCNDVKDDITDHLMPIHRDLGAVTARVDGHDTELKNLKADYAKTFEQVLQEIADLRKLMVQLAIFFVASAAGITAFVLSYIL